MKQGLSYGTWLRSWRRSGSPKHPDYLLLMIVYWTDAASHEGSPTPPIKSLMTGWLVKADEGSITLAMEAFEDQGAREFMSVPAGVVSGIFSAAEVPGFKSHRES
jgi:hypothetical protein